MVRVYLLAAMMILTLCQPVEASTLERVKSTASFCYRSTKRVVMFIPRFTYLIGGAVPGGVVIAWNWDAMNELGDKNATNER